jgi:hypothetical protein
LNPAVKLLGFGAILVVVFVAGLGLGAAIGPDRAAPAPMHVDHSR